MREQLTSKELIALIAKQNSDALEAFYERYEHRIYSFALRMMRTSEHAESLVAEIFKLVWLEAGTAAHFSNEADHWVLSICKKATLIQYRAAKSSTIPISMI